MGERWNAPEGTRGIHAWIPSSRTEVGALPPAQPQPTASEILQCAINGDFHECFMVEGSHRTLERVLKIPSRQSQCLISSITWQPCFFTLPSTHHEHATGNSRPLHLCSWAGKSPSIKTIGMEFQAPNGTLEYGRVERFHERSGRRAVDDGSPRLRWI